MNPFENAWQLLKANPSWMRSDANKGRIHTGNLPNPFDPNYREQRQDEAQRQYAELYAKIRRGDLIRQKKLTALENRNYDASNNQTVGLDKVPTQQIYGADSRLSPNQKFIEGLANKKIQQQEEKERQQYENKPTSDTNYQRFYSDYS